MNTASIVSSLSPEVLALLAASYGKPADKVVESAVKAAKSRKASKPSKLAAVKAQEKPAPEKREVPAAYLPIALPAVGTYDAPTFLAKVRALGPIFVGNHSEVTDAQRVQDACSNGFSFVQRRDAAMALIAGYCGFDRSRDFGAQLDMARNRAVRETRPTPRYVSATVSVAGYVAGMPDEQGKRVGDLLARERLASETMAEHETAAREAMARGDTANASLSAQMMLVEHGRINAIRADLRAAGINAKALPMPEGLAS